MKWMESLFGLFAKLWTISSWFSKEDKLPVNHIGTQWTSSDIGEAIALIKSWESFRSLAYKDSVGVLTIGYGTTVYPDGRKVQAGDTCTIDGAKVYLMQHISKHIVKPMNILVEVPLNTNHYNALISFIYNVGIGNFERSTMLKLINKGQYSNAANEFPKWNKAGGKVLLGLVRRRAAEQELFLRHTTVMREYS